MHESDISGTDEELANQIAFPSFHGSFELTSTRGCLSWDCGRTAVPPPAYIPIRFHTVPSLANKNSTGVSYFLRARALDVGKVLLDAALSLVVSHIKFPVNTAPGGFLVPCGHLEEYIWVMDPLIYSHPPPSGASEESSLGGPRRGVDSVAEKVTDRRSIGGRISTSLPMGEVQGRIPRFRDHGLPLAGCRGHQIASCWWLDRA